METSVVWRYSLLTSKRNGFLKNSGIYSVVSVLISGWREYVFRYTLAVLCSRAPLISEFFDSGDIILFQ